MKNMNIIICDDRIDDRKNLSDLLSDYGEKKNYEFAITEYDSGEQLCDCLLYTSPSPRDMRRSRMPSSA